MENELLKRSREHPGESREKGKKGEGKKGDRLLFVCGFRRSFLEPHNQSMQLISGLIRPI
jgi:hypothetical protein